MTQPKDTIEVLIERSSLGEAPARLLRARTARALADHIVARAERRNLSVSGESTTYESSVDKATGASPAGTEGGSPVSTSKRNSGKAWSQQQAAQLRTL